MKLLNQEEFVPNIERGKREGIHVSDVLSYTGGILGKVPDDDDIDDESKLRITLGLAFEDWLGELLQRENPGSFIYHPGEYEKNGIIGSPDGILVGPGGRLMPIEMKCTAKSARYHPVDDAEGKWWYWIKQGMSYVCLLPNCSPVCKYIVCYINGAYEKHLLGRARIVQYDVQFTEDELARHWNFMEINAGRVAERREREERIV